MRRVALKLVLLSVVTAIVIGSLPPPGQSASASAATQRSSARRRTRAASIVPSGTNMRVRLNDTISSKESRVGDRFTATVINPSKYEGGKLHGHVSSIRRSGTVTGKTTMTLAFDSINLREGRSGALRGQVIRVYDQDGDSGKVDEEGRVASGSRGKQAIKRGGIGAAAGAIIGGIAGGGKGAAIGLLVGGAAGAGSLAVQGKKELKLESGTELLVRVTR